MKPNLLQKKEEKSVTKSENKYSYTPKVDIRGAKDSYHLEIEMPGVDPDGVDVKLEDGILSILGRAQTEPFKGYESWLAEYETGNFKRQFKITEDIEIENIKASMKYGILHLTLPKREEAKAKRIEVKAA